MNHPLHTVYRTKPSTAESTLDLSNHDSCLIDRQLVISTRKSAQGLTTTATVQTVRNGLCTFIMGNTDSSDFHRRLTLSACRATDKAVRAQHQQALAGLEDLILQVDRHYHAQRNRQQAASSETVPPIETQARAA